jgi:hypothetical protein
MHRIKVQGPKREWGIIRRAIFWAAFCLLLAIAAYEAGWISRDFQKDETQKRVLKLETKFTDHDGRIVVLEGPPARKASAGKPSHRGEKRNDEHIE